MKAKARRRRTVTVRTIAEGFYERVKASKPLFADSAQALKHYSKKLEEFASQRKLTVEKMLIAIEDSSSWSAEDREVRRVARIVDALQAQ